MKQEPNGLLTGINGNHHITFDTTPVDPTLPAPRKRGPKPTLFWAKVADLVRRHPTQSEKEFAATVLQELGLDRLSIGNDSFKRGVRRLKRRT